MSIKIVKQEHNFSGYSAYDIIHNKRHYKLWANADYVDAKPRLHLNRSIVRHNVYLNVCKKDTFCKRLVNNQRCRMIILEHCLEDNRLALYLREHYM